MNRDDAFKVLRDLRGAQEWEECDSCGYIDLTSTMFPEEGGGFWCQDCVQSWEREHNCHWHNGMPKTDSRTLGKGEPDE